MTRAVRTATRIVFFRATREEIESLGRDEFVVGIACTWIVGVGRYWDHAAALLPQRLGLGSVLYVFVLAAFLWIGARPLANRSLSYRNLLIYITLTAPPGIVYAIPFEWFMTISGASAVNTWLLGIVAVWRLALYIVYVRRLGIMAGGSVLAVATLLPVMGIVALLAIMNMDRVVFDAMRGIEDPSPNDGAYIVLLVIAYLSVFLAPILLIFNAVLWAGTLDDRRRASASTPQTIADRSGPET